MNTPRNTTYYSVTGTETFRLASKAWLETYGTNLQNVEKSARQIYIPDDGKIFVQRDQSGAEALIVAYLCKPGLFRDLFLCNIKPHVFVALHLFQEKWQEHLDKTEGLDIKCNVQDFVKSEIKNLTSLPFWRELDKLIKSSDDWPSAQRYYYIAKQVCHCVDSQTQVLTKNGWVDVKNITTPVEIAVWDNDKITFEVPSAWNTYDYCGNMFHFYGDEVDQYVTPNHKIVYYSNYKYHIAEANQLEYYKRLNIPNSGNYEEGKISYSESFIRLLVAIQADAYVYSSRSLRFRFQKQRKVDRLKDLLNKENLKYEEKQTDAKEIYVHGADSLIKFLGEKKQWSKSLLNLSKQNLEWLVDELKYWDGTYEKSFNHKREAYFTKHYNNAVWIKTICHLIGRQGTLNKSDNSNGSITHVVGINNRKKGRVPDIKKFQYNGKVYCPTTSTGFFLIRRNGKISVTGNSSNYDIRPQTFRMNVLEKSKGKIVLSKQQAENYLSFYHGLFPEIKEWHREVQKQLEATRYLYSLQGYPRYFSREFNESYLKKAYAFVPQSTVGLITNIAYSKLYKFIAENHLSWDLLANTHDSYLVQCPIGEEVACNNIMKLFMNQTLTAPRGEVFTMKSEGVCGFNWAPYKPFKNELGLKPLADQ